MVYLNITIVGAGYVGLSLAVLLAKNNKVTALEVDKDKTGMINSGISPLKEKAIADALSSGDLNLTATTDKEEAYKDADIVIIAVPTNYNEDTEKFDTSILSASVDAAILLSNAVIIIKSTVPIGYTKEASQRNNTDRIMFSPEFMREGHSVEDGLNPSRIIIGTDTGKSENALICADLFKSISVNNPEILFMSSQEAEAVKLFSNTYLAMRIAFFNELDTFAEEKDLSSENIIKGVCADPRIGKGYANPSFGYGGYCLPKDSKQLVHEMKGLKAPLIEAIPKSNTVRISHIADRIASTGAKTVGIYGLAMKAGSDNARASSVISVANILNLMGLNVVVYDKENAKSMTEEFSAAETEEDFFKDIDIVVSNRPSESLKKKAVMYGKSMPYTRDVFGGDT